jgi:hypothetical protein
MNDAAAMPLRIMPDAQSARASAFDAQSGVDGVACSPDAGTVAFETDPAVRTAWSGNNGDFVDACDDAGNLTKYSCETQLQCSPGPDAECSSSETGAVTSSHIDCAGHCADGACPSRCPTFGDSVEVESIDASGGVVLRDAYDGRRYTCTLAFDQPGDGFDCISGVKVGSEATFSSQGFSGSYCTGNAIGAIGLCYPSASVCTGQNCTYQCSVSP